MVTLARFDILRANGDRNMSKVQAVPPQYGSLTPYLVIEPLSDKFYGDRAGSVKDPFGQRWAIMTHEEDLSPEETEKRMAQMSAP